jgi:broad specificity phosphatase PhoE
VVVDHLPCRNNELGLCTGVIEQGVSDFGRSLAHYVQLSKLDYGPIAAVCCSTLPRATESAQLCFGQCGIPIIQDSRLSAINYGDYHHQAMERILEIQPAYMYSPFPNGESYADMGERYRSFFDETQPHFDGRSVVVIGHYGTRELLTHLCSNVPLHLTFRPRVRTLGTRDLKEIIEERVAKAEYAVFDYSADNSVRDRRSNGEP